VLALSTTQSRGTITQVKIWYFWRLDQETQRYFKVYYQSRAEHVGDYTSKAHTASIHKHGRPYYQHEVNSPIELPRASKAKLTVRMC
jgi:hypothetical protein